MTWFVATGVVAAAACTASPSSLPPCVDRAPDGGPTIATEMGGDPVLLAVGDIVDPRSLYAAERTARLVDHRDGVVATLGDSVNTDVPTMDEYVEDYGMTWGRQRWRTRPAVGNHDAAASNGAPYFAYFCSAAGTPFEGWYSYDLGAWHIVVLNSELADGAAQLRWLEADLAAHPAACTLAYWHEPLFSSSAKGAPSSGLRAIWDLLARAHADVVLNGHWHHYERFRPQSPAGEVDDAHGIRELVVGTGGAPLDPPTKPGPHTEVLIDGVFGVLALTLHPHSYDWQFIAVDETTRDRGSASCHAESVLR